MTKKKERKTFQRPRGTHDIMPEDGRLWDKLRESIRSISSFYNFGRIETPHFEDTDLFSLGVGKATDIVSKQMYSFKTRGGDQLTLRPEGTAPIARAWHEHGMTNWPQPVKLYYLGAFFRHESPQRGRFREFNQWGLELIGDDSAVADAQIINIFSIFLGEWGMKDVSVDVNSVGCPVCRPVYRQQIVQYYRARVRGLCRDCKVRFRENPMRLLDCTEEKCTTIKKSAPQFIDRLCEICRNHFKTLLEFLDECSIPYVLNPHLVRGLDYYTRTVFEIFVDEAAKKSDSVVPVSEIPGGGEAVMPEKKPGTESARRLALVAGGRYDGLIELVGGKPSPAMGGAMGLERIVSVIKEGGKKVPEPGKPKVFLVQLGDLAKKKSFRLMEDLRKAGISMAESLGRDSIRSQLKSTDRLGAVYALILGQKEALDEMVILREMSSGIQETIPQSKLVETLKRKFAKH